MRRERKIQGNPAGFTLVEIITALAVIGVLIALLIPALSMVQKTALNVKQKAQFHTIEMALETFQADQGFYPPSEYNNGLYGMGSSASHRLAEALIGRDGLGFHPSSRFTENGLLDLDGDGAVDDPVYHATTDETYETAAQNRSARKGPYLEPENANAVKLGSIYQNTGPFLESNTYILADMYSRTMRTGKKTGMPILYYRANTAQIGHTPGPPFVPATWAANTYNLNDSWCNGAGLVRLAVPFAGPTTAHPLADENDAGFFYNAIWNPNFTAPPRPYRANSFLLHSAGQDGIYGTPDDVFNFDAGTK